MVILSKRAKRRRFFSTPYWGEQSDCCPFDAKGTISFGFRTLRETICNDRSPCCILVTLYAKMGLHRYNLIEGTKYQLTRVLKYHFILSPVPSPYYITCQVASDPSASSPQTFQTLIDEHRPSDFALSCNISRIQGETKKYNEGVCFLQCTKPEWPTENPFENGKLFYVLNHSEIQDNDWIRLYLELAVTTIGRDDTDPDLSNLEIVNVAMDTQLLNAKNATVYIIYKDKCEARVGKDVDRIAMVRRAFGERTGCFSLIGKHQSLKLLPKKGACEAGVGKDVQSSYNDEHTRCRHSEDDSCQAGVVKDVDRCLSPMDENLSSDKKCKDPQSKDEAGVVKDVDRCLSPMDKNLASDKKCKDPQSKDEAGVVKDVDRCLSGKNLASVKKCSKYQRRLGVVKSWRLWSPMPHKSYRKKPLRWLGSSSAQDENPFENDSVDY